MALAHHYPKLADQVQLRIRFQEFSLHRNPNKEVMGAILPIFNRDNMDSMAVKLVASMVVLAQPVVTKPLDKDTRTASTEATSRLSELKAATTVVANSNAEEDGVATTDINLATTRSTRPW